MVRNLSETDITTHRDRYRWWVDLGIQDPLPDSSGVMLGKREWQGDLVKSNHHSPTAYRAHRYSCTPSQSKCQTGLKVGLKYGLWRYYRDVYEGTINLPNPGQGDVDGKPWDYRFPDWVTRQARTDLLNALHGDSVDLGVMLGEMPEAISMVLDAVKTLARAYGAARRLDGKGVYKALRKGLDNQLESDGPLGPLLPGRKLKPMDSGQQGLRAPTYREFTAAANAARQVRNKALIEQLGNAAIRSAPNGAADLWLAYSFGWKPLLADIHSLMEQTMGPDGEGKTFSLVRTRTTSDLMSNKYGTGGIYRFAGGGVKGAQVGVVYRLLDPAMHQLAASGLANPATIAWELLPMSFLIDYLIPIGQALAATTGHMGLGFIHGYETKFSYGDLTVTRPGYGVPYGYYEVQPVQWKVKTFGMDRKPLISWPLPSLVIKSGITATQGINTLALLMKNGAS